MDNNLMDTTHSNLHIKNAFKNVKKKKKNIFTTNIEVSFL